MEQRLILDRYRPLATLGEGGQNPVVLAYDTRMSRRVAIKRLELPLGETGRLRSRRGLQEARMAAMLNHPNIVTVHEWDADDDEAFLIMEHIDGLSLGGLLDRSGGPLDLDEAATVLEDVSAALSFAHANGVLHLDLKPENLLITRDGRVKVADFGVAALTGLGGEASGAGGTLGYMPVEQLVGDPLDERADEWALGAVMYEALTFTNPFAAASIDDAILKIEFMDLPAPSEVRGRLPAGIDDAVLVALGRRRAERFGSVEEFAEELEPHLGDPAIGRKSLAELVTGYLESEESEELHAGVGLWDRLIARGDLLSRVAAVGTAAWLSWVAASYLHVTLSAKIATLAAVSLVAVFAPGLGFALALLAGAAGAWATGSSGAAVLVTATLAAYWWFFGREGNVAGVLPVLAPVFAWTNTAFALPLLLGFSASPGVAAATAAISAALCMVSAGASGSPAPFLTVSLRFIADPWATAASSGELGAVAIDLGSYITIAMWAIAAAVMSVMSARATRQGAVMGTVAGMGWIALGYMAWTALVVPVSITDPVVLWQAAGSLILMSLVIAAGPPARGES